MRLALPAADQSNNRSVICIAVNVRQVLRLRHTGIAVRYREGVVHVGIVECGFVLRSKVADFRILVLHIEAAAQVTELNFYFVFFINLQRRDTAVRVLVHAGIRAVGCVSALSSTSISAATNLFSCVPLLYRLAA